MGEWEGGGVGGGMGGFTWDGGVCGGEVGEGNIGAEVGRI